MFTFRENENFEPSVKAKRRWRYTKKDSVEIAGLPMPGLFQTANYEFQLACFVLVFIVEGAATWQAQIEGVVITAILASIAVDVVLAVISHLFQPAICQLKNEAVWANEAERGRIRRRLAFNVFWQRFFYVLILASAAFKFLWFYNVYPVLDAKAVFVGVMYLIGGLLHIFFTGYAVFTFFHEWLLRSEHNQYLDSNQKEYRFREDETVTEFDTVCEPASSRYAVVEPSNGKGTRLRTRGLLLDEDLRWLISRQKTPEQERALVINGVKHQMTIMNQEPVTGAAV